MIIIVVLNVIFILLLFCVYYIQYRSYNIISCASPDYLTYGTHKRINPNWLELSEFAAINGEIINYKDFLLLKAKGDFNIDSKIKHNDLLFIHDEKLIPEKYLNTVLKEPLLCVYYPNIKDQYKPLYRIYKTWAYIDLEYGNKDIQYIRDMITAIISHKDYAKYRIEPNYPGDKAILDNTVSHITNLINEFQNIKNPQNNFIALCTYVSKHIQNFEIIVKTQGTYIGEVKHTYTT